MLWLGLGAATLQLIGFALYNRQVFAGTSAPNAATWTLWAILTLLGAASYASLTSDPAKFALPVASALANVGTFGYSLLTGKFRQMDLWEYGALMVGILSGILWCIHQSAAHANIILTTAVGLAFVPLYRSSWKGELIEKPLPWLVWTAAYAINILVIVLSWNGQYVALLYPVTMFVLHAGIALASDSDERGSEQKLADAKRISRVASLE